jgi:hypothetical protein
MKNLSTYVNEAIDYEVYHSTYTSAVQAALEHAERLGYTYDEDDSSKIIGLNTAKPKNGETTKFSLPIYKNDKLQNKMLQVQVTDLSNNYELNCYIN